MPRRRRSILKLKLNQKSSRSVLSLIFLLVAFLLGLSYLTGSAISLPLQQYLNHFFGGSAILLPVLFLLLGLTLTQIKWFLAESRVLAGFSLSLVAFLGFLGLISPSAGGLLGYKIATTLVSIFSGFGAILILLATLLISVLMIFNTSLDVVLVPFLSIVKAAAALLKTLFAKRAVPNIGPEPQDNGKVDKTRVNEPGESRTMKIKGNLEPEVEIVADDNAPIIKTERTLSIDRKIRVENFGEQKIDLVPQTGIHRYQLPSLDILPEKPQTFADRGDVKKNAATIEKTLESFGIQAHVAEVNLGPSVTQYALELTEGTKIAKITALQNDLALSLAAATGSVRIEAPIPGRSLVGIELPNYSPSLVSLKTILGSEVMQNVRSKLAVGLGQNVAGEPQVADIGRWPHILIAGSTGSGKSVLIHTLLCSILFRATPDEVRFILIDPKRVELTQYNGIPHLLTPVIVEVEKVVSSLKWAVSEMEKRYKLFAQVGARNLADFNQKSQASQLPFIIIMVDELADVMAFAATEVESLITRIAQMSRATGIHLVLSTQRPSVDVITGLIKANIPARIALNVSSSIDSRVILDSTGAEKLLGKGDLLYLPSDAAKPLRIQGIYVSDDELNKVIGYWKTFANEGELLQSTGSSLALPQTYGNLGVETGQDGESLSDDKLFLEASEVIFNHRYASASLLQRKLRIGYARAARLIDEMEQGGLVGPRDGANPREVSLPKIEDYLKRSRNI